MKSEIEIKKILIRDGIMPNVKGYNFCIKILTLLKEEQIKIKEAYEIVAKKEKILPNSVEKNVSNAIAKAFLRPQTQNRYSPYCFENGKITNKKYFLLILKELERL